MTAKAIKGYFTKTKVDLEADVYPRIHGRRSPMCSDGRRISD